MLLPKNRGETGAIAEISFLDHLGLICGLRNKRAIYEGSIMDSAFLWVILLYINILIFTLLIGP
jgi:hypothetical protein